MHISSILVFTARTAAITLVDQVLPLMTRAYARAVKEVMFFSEMWLRSLFRCGAMVSRAFCSRLLISFFMLC